MDALSQLFQSSLALYIPLSVAVAFGLLFIPSLLVQGAKPENVGKAIGCYMMKTLGVVLVIMSGMQLVSSLIALTLPETPLLLALTLLLVIGIGIMVHESRVLATLDEASVMVPRLVYSHTCEVMGALIAIGASLSLIVTFIVTQDTAGWESAATLLILGITLLLASSLHISHRNRRAARKMRSKK